MSGKQILALVLAIVVGIVAVKVIFGVIGFVLSSFWWFLSAAVVGVAVYALYRKFNNMLTSGKRLT